MNRIERPDKLEIERHHIGLDERKRISRLRVDIDPGNVEACAMIAHRTATGTTEQVQESRSIHHRTSQIVKRGTPPMDAPHEGGFEKGEKNCRGVPEEWEDCPGEKEVLMAIMLSIKKASMLVILSIHAILP